MMERNAIYTKHKQIDESQEWDFIGANTQEHLHSLHSYPARFIPQIPRKAIMGFTQPGDLVLDPFCGCGTTLLESILLGRPAIGVDNNGVACLISKAKTLNFKINDITKLEPLQDCMYFEKNVVDWENYVPEYSSLSYWFNSQAIKDLAILKSKIEKLEGDSNTLALAIFSSIIVRVSYQDSDTRYSRQLREYETGKAIKIFTKKISDIIPILRDMVHVKKSQAEVHVGDSRDLSMIPKSKINLIATSPPYLNAYDYHKYHRHRLHWINADISFARDNEVGKHDVFTRPKATPDRYFEDMEKCFKEWHRVLQPGGKILIVIGDAIVSGKPVPVGDLFEEMCSCIGLTLLKRWIRTVDTNKKSFNQAARINKEHVLLFNKN